MKHFNSRRTRSRILGLVTLSASALFGMMSCTPDYDLDKRMPEWLGSSIYETLKEGFVNDNKLDPDLYGKRYSFKNFTRLIEDLDQVKILAKTGSKTLFVADDEAFDSFFAKGVFKTAAGNPVNCYDSLTVAQKNMILKGSMLNNVYQVAMLSSSEGPTLGDCMRRISSVSIYDTIPYVTYDKMPDSKFWKYYKDNKKNIVMMQDGSEKPMVFFVNKFLQMKKIEDTDYDFLFRQGPDYGGSKPARKQGEASVNGVKIEFQNKKCFNGFLHVMSDVIYSLPSMAEYLEEAENTQIYSSILNRFCAPYRGPELNEFQINVDRLVREGVISLKYTPGTDSIYQKRYFAERTYNVRTGAETKNNRDPNNHVIPERELLRYDPGWNSYFSPVTSTATNVAIQQNMGVMIVPTDEAMVDWWKRQPMRQKYGHVADEYLTLEHKDSVISDIMGVDAFVIVKLLRNGQLSSLVGSVPSKFADVLDDANDPMGIKTDDVVDVKMCCNGAIYLTQKVFGPVAYRSVSYPTLVDESLEIINWAIEKYKFGDYLNSMVATYSFFAPMVSKSEDPMLNGKLFFVDPKSFYDKTEGKNATEAMVFNFSKEEDVVYGYLYKYDPVNDSIYGDIIRTYTSSSSDGVIDNRLNELLDYHIIIGNVEDGHSYYQTKGRGTIKFDFDVTDSLSSNPDNYIYKSKVYGGYQLEADLCDTIVKKPVASIIKRYDLSKEGNGRTYAISRPLIPSRNSVFDVLSDSVNYPEFKEFFKLLRGSGLLIGETTGKSPRPIGSQFNISTMSTYHYTVYVPTNASIKALVDTTGGKIPPIYTPQMIDDIIDAYEDLDDEDEQEAMRLKIWEKHKVLAGIPTDSVMPSGYLPKNQFKDFMYTRLKDFVKYHIQDNSIYLGAQFNADLDDVKGGAAQYETAYLNEYQQFVKLSVKPSTAGDALSVTDMAKNVRSVTKNIGETGRPLYNIMCREYEYDSSDTKIETSSYVVIHQIDKPLCNGVVDFH